jgi:hypothetical protein
MVIIAIGWFFVVALFSVVHAASPGGTLVGALITLFGVGVLPVALLAYIALAPARRRQRLAADPDRGGQTPGDTIAPERKEP